MALKPVVEIEFDRALDSSTVTADSVSLHMTSDGSPISSSVTLRGDRIVRLTPLGTLAPHTAYFYEVSAQVRDVTGNAARELRRFFQTSEDSAGTTAGVRETLPQEEALNVSTESPIVIRFETALDPVSVTPDTIRLTADQSG